MKNQSPEVQLIFETREEAKNAFEEAMYISQESYNKIMEKAFIQWLSEQNVIIKENNYKKHHEGTTLACTCRDCVDYSKGLIDKEIINK
jgi:hypothetical protein